MIRDSPAALLRTAAVSDSLLTQTGAGSVYGTLYHSGVGDEAAHGA
jgi:hypothetical protein